ncbi:MAG: response regulator [Gemmatimonadaceae bacterium]
MMKLRCVVADDEPLVRQGLRDWLASDGACELVGEAADGVEALRLVGEHRPDVLFVDVAMPVLDGVSAVRELGAEAPPAVVFVTAFDQYAIQAFDLHAVDYLLKPFDEARFHRTLARVRERLGARQGATAAVAAARELKPAPQWPERLAVRMGSRVRFVDVRTLDCITAADNYVELHTPTERFLLRQTLKHLESSLDPAVFVRVHRSTVVNVTKVVEVRSQPSGDAVVVLSGGRQVAMSRAYRAPFQERMGLRL